MSLLMRFRYHWRWSHHWHEGPIFRTCCMCPAIKPYPYEPDPCPYAPMRKRA